MKIAIVTRESLAGDARIPCGHVTGQIES